MKNKFRICKIEKVNSNNEIVFTEYRIQVKRLFWFFDYDIRAHTETEHGVALINNRVVISFRTEEKAKNCLHNLENPMIERYKGHLIQKVISTIHGVIYINHNKTTEFSCQITAFSRCYWIGYMFTKTLSEMKDIIDKSQTTNKISILN